MKIIERIHNVKTDEITDIERDETANEKAERQAAESAFATSEAIKSAKTEQRAALLDKLGITEEEAKLLLG